MLLDLTRLADGRLDESFRLDPGSPLFDGFAAEVTASFDLDVTLRRAGSASYVVEARLAGSVSRPCRRCLAPVELGVADRFRAVIQIADRGEEVGDDDVVLLERGATRVDLTGLVRDRLFLGVDEYPVCDPDCAGICPGCGRNLNTGACGCEPEFGPSSWVDALQAVRDRVG